MSGFFQTDALRHANEAFALKLTVQLVGTAPAALEDLRARVRDPANDTAHRGEPR